MFHKFNLHEKITFIAILLYSFSGFLQKVDDVRTRYSEDKKHPKRLKAASMYNLAQIYLYMDMPEEAIAIGQEFVRWDYDEKDGKKFIERGEELKHLLDFHGKKRFFATEEDADKVDSEDETIEGSKWNQLKI